ncbi:MAG: stage II sporulation protein M [archaeon]
MRKQKSLREFYKESFSFIKDSKKYIYSILIIFILFLIVGYFASIPLELESLLKEKLKEIALLFQGLNLPATIWMIFSNNLYVSFLSMILGILFGFFPLITSMSNGFIIGYVMHKAVSLEGILTLWKLFPHGIFELPAVIISMGIGLRLGMTLLFKTKLLKKESLRSLFVFLLIIIPLLVIAAIIEGCLVLFIK